MNATEQENLNSLEKTSKIRKTNMVNTAYTALVVSLMDIYAHSSRLEDYVQSTLAPNQSPHRQTALSHRQDPDVNAAESLPEC